MRLKILVFILILAFMFSVANAQNITYTRLMGVREVNGDVDGVVADLIVEVREGTGRVFIETKPLTQINTQASARLSKEVACRILEMDCSKYDFFYIIESDYQIIGGPSAGAAMTTSTIAALHGVDMNQDVFVTGTINPAGSIGPVGSIIEKAEVAHSVGGRILIIPDGHGNVFVDELGKEIDIIELARRNWGIHLIEANNILDAYKYLTGYEIIIEKEVPTQDVFEEYNTAMLSLSGNLLRQAENSKSRLERGLDEIDELNLSRKEEDSLIELLKQSQDNLLKARESLNKRNFYSASSFSVRSLMSSRFAINMIDYYGANQSDEFIIEKFEDVEKKMENIESFFLDSRRINDKRDIEVYAVVIDRLREAEDLLDSAEKAYQEGNMDTAIYLLSFSEIKRNTAYEWFTLIEIFEGELDLRFNVENIKGISRERIEHSKTTIIYASTVTENQILRDAQSQYDRAVEAYEDGKYVYALFEASKARANANLAMEIRGVTEETVQNKIDFLEEEANRAISRAEEKGILPILALSYLEFGMTLKDEEPVQALMYLSYSREMAQISEDLIEATLERELLPRPRIQIEKYYEHTVLFDRRSQLAIEVLVLTSGVLLGALISLYVIEGKKF